MIAAHQAGFGNVVASMGTSLTERQFRSIASQVDQIVLCMDGDVAGQCRRATEPGAHGGQELGAASPGMKGRLDAEIKYCRALPAGKDPDPDDLIRADHIGRFGAAFIATVRTPLAELPLFDAIVAQAGVDTRDSGRAKAFSRGDPLPVARVGRWRPGGPRRLRGRPGQNALSIAPHR